MTQHPPMTRYRATELHDNDLPWFCWDQTEQDETRPMQWGVTLVPTQVYEDQENPETFLYYQWSAMLPEGTILPSWIQQVT